MRKLNFCVRNGNRWILSAIIAAIVISIRPSFSLFLSLSRLLHRLPRRLNRQSKTSVKAKAKAQQPKSEKSKNIRTNIQSVNPLSSTSHIVPPISPIRNEDYLFSQSSFPKTDNYTANIRIVQKTKYFHIKP